MLFRLHFLLHCICFLYNQFLFFSYISFCRMCVCHMFNKVLTYLLTYLLTSVKNEINSFCIPSYVYIVYSNKATLSLVQHLPTGSKIS